MKICVVGNGKGSLQFENGSFIDGCDLVVRMNRFELSTQLAPHLGTRTDIYLTDIKGLFDRTPEEIRNFREIWFPTPSPPSTWNTTTLPDWRRCQEEILREFNYV